MKRALLLLALLVGLPDSLGAQQAAGPSFDCARARAWDERVICAQADLSELDRRIAAAWRAVTEGAGAEDRTRLQAEQRAWLGERRACQGPVEREAQSCLRRVMRARARDLEAVASAGRGTSASGNVATKPPPAVAPAPSVLRAVSCPSAAGWTARTICATPGMRELDALILRDVGAARARFAAQPAALGEVEAIIQRYVAERDACARAAGRVPVDCLQETMEAAQAALRQRIARG